MSALPAPHDTGATGVLIVDDEAQIVQLLSLYLGQQGLRVIGAQSPDAALAALGADPGIAVVVTDLRLPGMSGPELVQRMRLGRDETTALEVILITGAGAGDLALEALRGQVAEVLRKPFRPSEVAAAVTRARSKVEHRRQAAAGKTGGAPGPTAQAALRDAIGRILAEATALSEAAGPLTPDETRMRAGRMGAAARQALHLVDQAAGPASPSVATGNG